MAIQFQQNLRDGSVVVVDSDDGQEFVLKPGVYHAGMTRAEVDAAVEAAALEWDKERGPDSEVGKNLEAGTPKTDHSSEPQ